MSARIAVPAEAVRSAEAINGESLAQGERLQVRGTVKSHGQNEGEHQTVIQRVKLA